MQSWPAQGQNNGDGNNSWQQNFNFAPQNGQFDQDQAWSQPMPSQNTYSRQLNPADPAGNFLQDPQPVLPGYQDSHEPFDLGQQYAGQDVIDPAFSNIHPDLYAQQNKIDLGGGNVHPVGQVQGHAHPHPQGFSSHNYGSFDPQPQNGQQYGSAAPQYTAAQLMPQPTRQQTHTPVQQYSNIQPGFAQPQLRRSQQSPVPHQQPYSENAGFAGPQVNGQGVQYQSNQNAHVNYQQQPTTAYTQPSYASPQSFEYQQPTQTTPNQTFSTPVQPAQQQAPGAVPQPDGGPQQPQQRAGLEQSTQPPAPEGPAKKRQRVTRPATDSPVPESTPHSLNSPIDSAGKSKVEELDSFEAPTPSSEEAQIIQQFQKRSKTAQAKFPSIKGLPHLVCESTVKLPAPKSYDKLAPLVAASPRSEKPIVPELGYNLPCEIQGRFTSRYRPTFGKTGLDERRIEAKPLLDEFDNSMKALGKRRPKYTEYPHAFKEQLKSDEASKNKAEKKAKKEQEKIRSATRPDDPVEAAAWDAIGIVHIDQSVSKTHALVAGRVQQAGDFFVKLRSEMNQTKQELDQANKDNKSEAEVAQLKKEAEQKKEALHRALDATIEHADDSIMDNLSGHQKLVLSLVNVLISSIKAGDFSGKLPKIVLELFTHFPMTKKIAETTNFDTVRKRFADKGDDDVKELVREISAKVRKVLKAADQDTSTGYTGTSAASRTKTAAKPATGTSSTKRGRDDDASTDNRTVKKVAVESGSGSLSKKLAQPKIQLQSASKTTAAKATASSILGDKARPAAKPASRPESAGGDSPADDKSKVDTKKASSKAEAARIAPTKAEAKPPAPKMGAAPTSSALSGIASLLDSINAPRAVTPPSPPKESKGPETPESEAEKAKRLRKEARRKLRVSWKPEGELVQVKIFEKEDEEDEGRDMNMIRDAADDKSEGMVLKQRADVEEDEEDDDPYQPWLAPNPTDLSNLPEEVRNKNFTTRGGNVSFTTDEQERIAQREQRELMAIYTDLADIPPSPKSPPPDTSAAVADAKISHLPREGPKFEEIQVRWRDEQQMGVDGALYSATQRLNAKSSPSNQLDSILGRLQGAPSQAGPPLQPVAAGRTTMGEADTNVPLTMGAAVAEQVLAWLRSDQAKGWRDPSPIHVDPMRVYHYGEPAVQAAGVMIEGLARSLSGKPYPATSPPDWLAHDEERVREWWLGHNKEAAVRQKRAEGERASAEAQANAQRAAAAVSGQGQGSTQDWGAYYAQQQQSYGPYMAILQQLNGGQNQNAAPQHAPGAAQPPQIADNQLQSILAAMNQPQQHQQPPQALPNPGAYHPNDPSYQQLMMLTQQMTQGQQPQHTTGGEHDRGREWDWERHDWERHDWDNGHDHDDHGRSDHHGRGGKESKKKKPGPSTIHKPPNAALIGTKPCTFWQQGKCARGDKCTFRHD